MFSLFFISRPIFAAVISILIVLGGAAAYLQLPVSRYPDITPPVVRVSASYPGANAKTLVDTVAAPIEQQVNGVDNMIYMNSTNTSDGAYSLDVSFKVGTDVDSATVLVQNRVSAANAQLPDDVKRTGVTTVKQSSELIAVYAVSSPNGRYDELFLSNYITLNIKDELLRIPGVGAANIFPSSDYSMRVWLDPEKLKARNMAVTDVIKAVQEQNMQVAAGQVGQEGGGASGQNFQLSVTTQGRLENTDQFANIIVKRGADSQLVRLKDVARIELGGDNYSTRGMLNGKPSALVVVYLSPGANMVNVASSISKKMELLSKQFPQDMRYDNTYDASLFVTESIKAVYHTLFEAFILVALTVLAFLQNWRATLIPIITIPVALIGTFMVMSGLGYTINMLTLSGLVLAIGIVVDDAIVVVENVERIMKEQHLSAKEATAIAMKEITGAIIAITLVLMAVFIPSALQSGISGRLAEQFAITIAVTTLFSAINALTLSPALCGLLLKQHDPHHTPGFLVRTFEGGITSMSNFYNGVAAFTLKNRTLALVSFAICIGLTVYMLKITPSGFLPEEDQGVMMVDAQLPQGASLQRTADMAKEVQAALESIDGVANIIAIPGTSFIDGNGSNKAMFIVPLTPWDERAKTGRNLRVIMQEANAKLQKIQSARILPFNLPSIPGLGTSSGFDLRILDKTNQGADSLGQTVQELLGDARQDPQLAMINSFYTAGTPQIFVDIDREKATTMNVPLDAINKTLQTYLGSYYVNDFNLFGRSYRVRIQAEGKFRATANDISSLEVRNADGEMLPLSAFVKIKDSFGPDKITRFNMFTSASVTGKGAPGISSNQALNGIEALAEKSLPNGMGLAFSGMSFEEKAAAGAGGLVFVMGMVAVYLILAAMYESVMLPLAVILAVPLAIVGAMIPLLVLHLDNNLYTQIALTLLIALGAKNAILIVEFARDNRMAGKSIVDSAYEAAKTRFRPIMMTSIAFTLGVWPLVAADGAGAASQKSLGIALFGGMIGATILALLFVPVLYVAIQSLREWKKPAAV
jgi:HAE1 family hydrophobic/amphiphilic exporter-1